MISQWNCTCDSPYCNYKYFNSEIFCLEKDSYHPCIAHTYVRLLITVSTVCGSESMYIHYTSNSNQVSCSATLLFNICDPIWQKGTYSLSNCVTLWAIASRGWNLFPWNFHRILYYAAGFCCAKFTVIDYLERKLWALKVRKVERLYIYIYIYI